MSWIFNLCVDFLQWLASITGLTYKEVNVWIFCIIWPVITLYLIFEVLRLRKVFVKRNSKQVELPPVQSFHKEYDGNIPLGKVVRFNRDGSAHISEKSPPSEAIERWFGYDLNPKEAKEYCKQHGLDYPKMCGIKP